jgi:chorismate--pyruvate lyase
VRERRIHWFKHQPWRKGFPEAVRACVRDRTSLTRRLRQMCDRELCVQVLQQRWQRPLLDEARLLGLSHREYAWVRQVELICGNTPWVFARTVIPRSSLQGRQQRLARLGTRPLGAVLFADPSLWRRKVEVARLEFGQPLFKKAARLLDSPPQELWARRSLFCVEQSLLLVSELFLPPLLQTVTP